MESKDHRWNIDRRAFLRISSLAGIAGLIDPRELIASLLSPEQTRVAIVEDTAATDGEFVNGQVVQDMMDSGIKALTARYDVGEAWKSLFPDIDSSKVIAIKVNCNNDHFTHPAVTNAVVEGLKKIQFGEALFPENNIIVYERRDRELKRCGYVINTSSTGVRCIGTNQLTVAYSSELYDVYGVNNGISNIVHEMADYLVNIGPLKGVPTAGISVCMKNHYGTCNQPASMHENDCDPYIPALSTIPPILDKQCVNIADALFGSNYGFPSYTINKIIISQDPVAVDYLGREILNEHGLPLYSLTHYIDTAAEPPYNLGTNDPNQMYIINITNPSTGIDQGPDRTKRFELRQNFPNPFSNHTEIRFFVSEPERVTLTIFDVAGRRVRTLFDDISNAGWRTVSWDGRNDTARRVASGIYFCRLKAKNFHTALSMQRID